MVPAMLQGSKEKPRIKPTEGLLSTASERQDREGETTKLVSKSGGPWFEWKLRQRSYVTCLRSHSQYDTKPELKLRQISTELC